MAGVDTVPRSTALNIKQTNVSRIKSRKDSFTVYLINLNMNYCLHFFHIFDQYYLTFQGCYQSARITVTAIVRDVHSLSCHDQACYKIGMFKKILYFQ